jgi:tetratricopeptide (TPR) repeat protein
VTANVDVARLQRSLDWGLEHSLSDRELVLMLRPLVRATAAQSAQGMRSRLHLAERLLRAEATTRGAWEAASLCHCVLGHSHHPEEQARALGALGLAYTLLGQFKAARAAYRRALGLEPADPVVAHNLGHLEVVHFGRLNAGLRWLAHAHRLLQGEPEVAASLAHALVRNGDLEQARAILARAGLDSDEIQGHLQRWASH